MSSSIICEAIRNRAVLVFDYHGLPRVVAPYAHGYSTRGAEVLRGIQLRGASTSGQLGFGKLWLVSDLVELRMPGELFLPDDPHYNPKDRGMRSIHCHI